VCERIRNTLKQLFETPSVESNHSTAKRATAKRLAAALPVRGLVYRVLRRSWLSARKQGPERASGQCDAGDASDEAE
jgi:hypothetical protein